METVNKLKILDTKLENKLNGKENEEDNKRALVNEIITLNKPILENANNIQTMSELKRFMSAIDEIYETVSIIKEENDLKLFYESGKSFDYEMLKDLFLKNELYKKFPKFDIDKYISLLKNPITKIKNFRGETVKYDNFWINKNLIAINQMIFNEMDLYILNIGKEGSGKSCWSSQQILYFYTFLREVGLIDYSFDVTKMFFVDIVSFLEEHEQQGKNDYFRIECLDEGNELNRSNFREETNQQFKYEMRTERKMLRVIMINMQQLGELDTSISLSRVNFIYNCKMRSNKRAGLLTKGFIDMYIIPRGEEIYTEKHKTVLTRQEILNIFAHKLDKKKDYYVNLPRDLIIKSFRFENVWGFDKDEYDSHVKDKMIERKFGKKIKVTDNQAYIFYTKLSNWKDLKSFDLDDKIDIKMYEIMKKFFLNINNYFISNPEKLAIMRNHYRKV